VNEGFTLDVVVEHGITRIVVNGEIDLASVADLESAFERSVDGRGGPVVLDLSGCDFVDSTGARTLVLLGRRVEGEARPFSLVSPPDSGARFTLDLLGVPDSFPVHDSYEKARADTSSDGTSG
jgi:anti-anti-sigma factor